MAAGGHGPCSGAADPWVLLSAARSPSPPRAAGPLAGDGWGSTSRALSTGWSVCSEVWPSREKP